jgi:hypothetical protein
MAARAHFVTGSGKKPTVPIKAVIRRGEVTPSMSSMPRMSRACARCAWADAGNGELEVLAGVSAGDRVSLEPIQSGIQLKQVK